MAKAHEPIKLTFLREGELSIDNSDTGGFTYLGIAYNKNKSFTVINEILEFVGNELIKLGTERLLSGKKFPLASCILSPKHPIFFCASAKFKISSK